MSLSLDTFKIIIEDFNKFIDTYEGIITFFGFTLTVIGIWLTFLSMKSEKQKHNDTQEVFLRALISEIYEGMGFVSRIEKSYFNNLNDTKNDSHIPMHPPSYNVLDKVVSSDSLYFLKTKGINTYLVLKVWSNLKELVEEYKKIELSHFLEAANYIEKYTREAYMEDILLKRLLEKVNVCMRNMIVLWIDLIKDKEILKKTGIKEFIDFKDKLKELEEYKRVSDPVYKSDFFKGKKVENCDVILCWENNWIDSQKEIIEISKLK